MVPDPGCFKPVCLQFLRGNALLRFFAPFAPFCICALLRSFAFFGVFLRPTTFRTTAFWELHLFCPTFHAKSSRPLSINFCNCPCLLLDYLVSFHPILVKFSQFEWSFGSFKLEMCNSIFKSRRISLGASSNKWPQNLPTIQRSAFPSFPWFFPDLLARVGGRRQRHQGKENARERWGLGARIPALWAWHPSILQCQGKESVFSSKNGKLILVRLFITRILIWRSGRNRGSFLVFSGGGRGFCLFPLRTHTRLTIFHPSLFFHRIFHL